MTMTLLTTFVFTTTVLSIIGLTALALTRRTLRRHPTTNAEACVTGSCGETMTLRISVRNGRIAHTSFKTKGCAYSFSCLQSAADAARGRPLLQVLDIDADFIARKVGYIPQDHRHCATLAAQTLHTAINRHMQRQSASEPINKENPA